MKTVMLVGGGQQEVRAIEFARELGYRTVVTDRNPDAPCAALADESHVIDGMDVGGLIALATDLVERDRLHGVFTLTELVTSVAAISEALGLPGAELASAVLCQDKGLAKERWLERGIETPAGRVIRTRTEALAALEELAVPAIVKPVEGFGARGVAPVDEPAQLQRYLAENDGKARAWVLEERVTGSSHDVNGIFDGAGLFHPQGIADREFVPGTFAEHEVHAPTRLSVDQQDELYDLLRRCAEAFDIDSGPVKGDAVLVGDRFTMLEIAPRLHGPKMSLYALPESGQDHWADFLSVITGGPIVGPADREPAFFQSRSIPAEPGRIDAIDGVDEVRAWEGVVEVMIFRGPGDEVPALVNSTDVVGYVLAATDERERTGDVLTQALDTIRVRTR